MKTEYIYGFLGLLLLVNLFLMIKFMNSRKRQVGINKQNNDVVYKEQSVSKDTSREDKTEVVSASHKKASTKVNNAEIKIGSIPKLDDLDKTELQSAIINSRKRPNEDVTEVEEIKGSEQDFTSETLEEKRVYGTINYTEGGVSKELKISSSLINIGRDPKYCDLVLTEDKFVGRNHALIYVKNSEIFFVDLNSKNGSFLNNQRITGQIKVENDTMIKIAHTETLIKVGG